MQFFHLKIETPGTKRFLTPPPPANTRRCPIREKRLHIEEGESVAKIGEPAQNVEERF